MWIKWYLVFFHRVDLFFVDFERFPVFYGFFFVFSCVFHGQCIAVLRDLVCMVFSGQSFGTSVPGPPNMGSNLPLVKRRLQKV